MRSLSARPLPARPLVGRQPFPDAGAADDPPAPAWLGPPPPVSLRTLTPSPSRPPARYSATDRNLPRPRRLPQIAPEVLFPSGDADRAPTLGEWVNWDPTGRNPGHSFGPRMRLQDLPREQRVKMRYDDPAVAVYIRELEARHKIPAGLLLSIVADGEQTDYTTGNPTTSTAKGLGQLLARYRKLYNDTDPDDPISSLQGAAGLLLGRPIPQKFLRLYPERPVIARRGAAAQYNGGNPAGDDVLLEKDQMPRKPSVRQYVNRVEAGVGNRTPYPAPVCLVPESTPFIAPPLGLKPGR